MSEHHIQGLLLFCGYGLLFFAAIGLFGLCMVVARLGSLALDNMEREQATKRCRRCGGSRG